LRGHGQMEHTIAVKKMTAAEIEPVTSIYAEVFHPGYISFRELAAGLAEGPGKVSDRAIAIFREQLIEMLDSDSYGLFVATVDDTVVGFSLASLHQAEAGHIECWLDDLGIRREWKGRGIGQALMERMLEWGRRGHARYFLADAGLTNEPGHRLVERFGFQPLATVFWRDGTDEPHFR